MIDVEVCGPKRPLWGLERRGVDVFIFLNADTNPILFVGAEFGGEAVWCWNIGRIYDTAIVHTVMLLIRDQCRVVCELQKTLFPHLTRPALREITRVLSDRIKKTIEETLDVCK